MRAGGAITPGREMYDVVLDLKIKVYNYQKMNSCVEKRFSEICLNNSLPIAIGITTHN